MGQTTLQNNYCNWVKRLFMCCHKTTNKESQEFILGESNDAIESTSAKEKAFAFSPYIQETTAELHGF